MCSFLKKSAYTYRVLSGLFILLVALNDLYRVQTGIVVFPPLLREILIACVLVVQTLRLFTQVPARGGLLQLKGLAFWVLFLYVVNLVLGRQIDFDPDSFGTITLEDLLIWTGFGILLIYQLFRLLRLLLSLFLVQQGPKTERHIRFYFFAIFLVMGYTILKSDPWQTHLFEGTFVVGESGWEKALFGLVLIAALLLGFRTKWIHYLRKREKWLVFFLGIVVYGLSQTFIYEIPETVASYSNMLRIFSSCVLLLWTVYGGLSLLGLLIQLPAAAILDKRMEEIETLQDLSAALGTTFAKDQVVEKTTSLVRQFLQADCAWIELNEKQGFIITGLTGIGREAFTRLPPPGFQPIRQSAIEEGRTILIHHTGKDRRTAHLKTWRKAKAGSLIVTRLQIKESLIGVLYAYADRPFSFMEESRGLFQAFANQAAIAIENASLMAISIEQERYREELRLAHEAQMRLLPRHLPQGEGFELGSLCVTANEIGGDFYDILSVDEDRIDLLVGDVSGKGADAAFYMAELKGAVQVLAYHFKTPLEILTELNALVRRQFDPTLFVTMVYGIYTPSRCSLKLARAGHMPVLCVRGPKIQVYEPAGLGLGLTDVARFRNGIEEISLALSPQDRIWFYTDGLIEARNPQGEEFGEERLKKAVVNLEGESAEAVVSRLRHWVDQFRQHAPMHDDLTVVLLWVKGKTPRKARGHRKTG